MNFSIILPSTLTSPRWPFPFSSSLSWEAASRSAAQEFPNTSWNPKILSRTHKSTSLVSILSQINPVHTIPSYLSKIRFNSTPAFLIKTVYTFLTARLKYPTTSVYIIWPARLQSLPGGKLRRSSLYNFSYPLVTVHLFGSNIIIMSLLSQSLALCSSLRMPVDKLDKFTGL
jgi:hypothetical protein